MKNKGVGGGVLDSAAGRWSGTPGYSLKPALGQN